MTRTAEPTGPYNATYVTFGTGTPHAPKQTDPISGHQFYLSMSIIRHELSATTQHALSVAEDMYRTYPHCQLQASSYHSFDPTWTCSGSLIVMPQDQLHEGQSRSLKLTRQKFYKQGAALMYTHGTLNGQKALRYLLIGWSDSGTPLLQIGPL